MTNDEIRPSAFVKHQLPGRVRLKIPQKRGDVNYFDRLAGIFSKFLGITELKLNPSAASILISHRIDLPFQNIVEFAETRNLFSLRENPEDHDSIVIPNLPITTLTSAGLSRVDNALLDFSQGRLDARSLLFMALIGLAIHQATRGNIMVPALTLLGYAVELLNAEDESQIAYENKADAKNE